MNTIKNYNELRFIDDYLFVKILTSRLDLCKELLEVILDVKIDHIEISEGQKTIDLSAKGHSIRLDVYVADEEHTVYDLEMQTYKQRCLPKRSRYYQSMIDINLLEKGASYDELKKSFVIFICLQDPFDKGAYVYHLKTACLEYPDLDYDEEAYKVYINASGTAGDISDELKDFLAYICNEQVKGDLAGRIHEAVQEARLKEEWRMEYMTYNIWAHDARYAGREEGREEGQFVMINNALKNAPEEQVKALLGVSDSDIAAAKEYNMRTTAMV